MNSVEIKKCPFDGGNGVLRTTLERSGYGEYETSEKYSEVICDKCHAVGPIFHVKHLKDFTKYTVADFRNNPILRAEVEDEYDLYCKDIAQKTVEAWNKRFDPAVTQDEK